MLLNAQVTSEAGTSSTEQIIHVALEQFILFVEQKWGCNRQPYFVEILHDTKQFLNCLFQNVIN
jgi:hypothetical protein